MVNKQKIKNEYDLSDRASFLYTQQYLNVPLAETPFGEMYDADLFCGKRHIRVEIKVRTFKGKKMYDTIELPYSKVSELFLLREIDRQQGKNDIEYFFFCPFTNLRKCYVISLDEVIKTKYEILQRPKTTVGTKQLISKSEFVIPIEKWKELDLPAGIKYQEYNDIKRTLRIEN